VWLRSRLRVKVSGPVVAREIMRAAQSGVQLVEPTVVEWLSAKLDLNYTPLRTELLAVIVTTMAPTDPHSLCSLLNEVDVLIV